MQFAANALQGRARDAVAVAERLHDRFILSSFELSNRHVDRIDAELRGVSGANLIVFSAGGRGRPPVITGGCPGLAAMGQPCRNGPAHDSELLGLATLGGQTLVGGDRPMIQVGRADVAPRASVREIAVVSTGPMDIAAGAIGLVVWLIGARTANTMTRNWTPSGQP